MLQVEVLVNSKIENNCQLLICFDLNFQVSFSRIVFKGGFLGFGPQSKAPLDDILEIRNNVIKEESIDELTKKLEDVAMKRSQQQTMKKDDPNEIRPLSGESSGTVIDLITNDLQQGKLL